MVSGAWTAEERSDINERLAEVERSDMNGQWTEEEQFILNMVSEARTERTCCEINSNCDYLGCPFKEFITEVMHLACNLV